MKSMNLSAFIYLLLFLGTVSLAYHEAFANPSNRDAVLQFNKLRYEKFGRRNLDRYYRLQKRTTNEDAKTQQTVHNNSPTQNNADHDTHNKLLERIHKPGEVTYSVKNRHFGGSIYVGDLPDLNENHVAAAAVHAFDRSRAIAEGSGANAKAAKEYLERDAHLMAAFRPKGGSHIHISSICPSKKGQKNLHKDAPIIQECLNNIKKKFDAEQAAKNKKPGVSSMNSSAGGSKQVGELPEPSPQCCENGAYAKHEQQIKGQSGIEDRNEAARKGYEEGIMRVYGYKKYDDRKPRFYGPCQNCKSNKDKLGVNHPGITTREPNQSQIMVPSIPNRRIEVKQDTPPRPRSRNNSPKRIPDPKNPERTAFRASIRKGGVVFNHNRKNSASPPPGPSANKEQSEEEGEWKTATNKKKKGRS